MNLKINYFGKFLLYFFNLVLLYGILLCLWCIIGNVKTFCVEVKNDNFVEEALVYKENLARGSVITRPIGKVNGNFILVKEIMNDIDIPSFTEKCMQEVKGGGIVFNCKPSVQNLLGNNFNNEAWSNIPLDDWLLYDSGTDDLVVRQIQFNTTWSINKKMVWLKKVLGRYDLYAVYRLVGNIISTEVSFLTVGINNDYIYIIYNR